MRHINAAGTALIKSFEQCRLTAYRDGGGVLTIGWGHTGPDVRAGLVITQEHADSLYELDIARFEEGVESLLTVQVSDNKFAALVSIAYNVGLDIDDDTKAEGLGDSTLLKKVNAGDFAGAALEFAKWNHDNGKVVAGLTRRRAAEAKLFETA